MAVPLPRLLMRLVDPANVYFADRSPGRRREPPYRGGAIFGPGVPGGSRQASPEELAELRQQLAVSPGGELDPRPPACTDTLRRAAESLVRTGSAVIGAPPNAVHARVVSFWRGDSILEVSARNGRTGGLTRIPRNLGHDDEAMLASYLAGYVAPP